MVSFTTECGCYHRPAGPVAAHVAVHPGLMRFCHRCGVMTRIVKTIATYVDDTDQQHLETG